VEGQTMKTQTVKLSNIFANSNTICV